MRTWERLITVCQSLNPATVGRANVEAMQMGCKRILWRDPWSSALVDELRLIARQHPSPHVRELAAELLALK